MTDKEIIHKILFLHAGHNLKGCPMNHLTPKDTWEWIDNMNKALVGIPYFYLLTTGGIKVMKK